MRRYLAVATAATVILAVATGSAASLGGLVARELSAGNATVSSCDADGVAVAYTVNAGLIDDITVSGIAGACAGGVLRAVVTNSSGASLGVGGPTTVAGASAQLTLSPKPTGTAVAGTHISIVGP